MATTLKAENQATGDVQPAVLPIWKSPVAVGILVSIIFKVIALAAPEFVTPEGTEQEVTQLILLIISGIGDLFALFKRVYSPLQPITIVSAPTAENVTKVTPVVLACLFLAGCNTTAITSPTKPTVVGNVIEVLPAQVQSTIIEKCNWAEPLTNIAAIVATMGGWGTPGLLNMVANEVCGVVTSPTPRAAAPGRVPLKEVRGVRLQGQRV